MAYPRISKLNTPELFQGRLRELRLELPFESSLEHGQDSPLGQAIQLDKNKRIGNRFCVLPMEGWDGTNAGEPTDLTRRRWRNFGISGAKLIWGGEAVAVRHDGRANPNQLMLNQSTIASIESLRTDLVSAHRERFHTVDDLLVGLQLTHSGRFARPHDKKKLEPRTVYAHPILDQRFSVDARSAILTDDDLKQLIDDFVNAAGLAWKAGFEFVDIKHCHGYLGHELLSGHDRNGEFGGTFENRTKFLCEIVSGIQSNVPGLRIGVRVSVFDFCPFEPGPDARGTPTPVKDYKYGWGSDETGRRIDLDEPNKFLSLLNSLGVKLVCTTAGSPYYNPHIQRPAIFPPSDGYLPPEDPLVGVARQIKVTSQLKAEHPELVFVGSGYSYLQEWLPHVGQAAIRSHKVDAIGLGRMVLSYPDLPADVLEGKELMRKRICRTFSDCTSAPRQGLVSGCYPLDGFYKKRSEFAQLAELKKQLKAKS